MGSGTFDAGAYRTFTSSTVGKSTDAIYTSRKMSDKLNPYGVTLRESRDSADNPNSTPIIIALDVTGSMGVIADNIAREGLGTLFESILSRKTITNPHLMFMGVGDAYCDKAPLQVSQFEADARIIQQLTEIWLEKGGGGNNSESYNLPWYFAGFHTEHDAFIKRGKKGFLFTIGDEEVPDNVTKEQIQKIFGDSLQSNMSSKEMLEIAERTYHVFHIIIEQGSHARRYPDRVKSCWQEMLGQRVISLSDYTKLAETIVTAIEVTTGVDVASSLSQWDDNTKRIVNNAMNNLPKGRNFPRLGAK